MQELHAHSPSSLLALCGLGLVAIGCGQSPSSRNTEAAGSVGLALQVSPGTTVSNATYTISGPNDFTSAGSVLVGESADVPVTVSHLPLGSGYEMDVSATASDGVTTCEGSATFDVTTTGSSTVIVHLACGVPSGSVGLSGTINVCPMLDSLGASPGAVLLGGVIALTSSAHDLDNGPASLSYKWTVNGAPLKQAVPNLNFACSSPGMLDFMVSVSDGDPAPSCADSLSVQVGCSAP